HAMTNQRENGHSIRRTNPLRLRRSNRRKAARRDERVKSRRRAFQMLEDRVVLAGLVTVGPNLISSGAGLIDQLTDLLPADIRDSMPQSAEQLLDLVDSGTIYQAFPGEVNQVTVEGDLGNFLLLFGERSEVT